METSEIIRKLCKENHISVTDLESKLGFSNGSLTKGSFLRSDRLYEVAKFFNVSMEYLLHGDDIFKNDENIKDIPLVDFYITEPEKLLIEAYRKSDMKAAVDTLLKLNSRKE